MVDTKIEEPGTELPQAIDPLFVLRPIGKYEPIQEVIIQYY